MSSLLLRLHVSLNSFTVEQFYAKLGAREPDPVVSIDGTPTPASGVPSHAFPPACLGIPSDGLLLDEAKRLLSDFGVAFQPPNGKSRFQSSAPLVVRSPESYFEPMPLTLTSDIWSLVCLIFELFAHRSLIDGITTPQDDIATH